MEGISSVSLVLQLEVVGVGLGLVLVGLLESLEQLVLKTVLLDGGVGLGEPGVSLDSECVPELIEIV